MSDENQQPAAAVSTTATVDGALAEQISNAVEAAVAAAISKASPVPVPSFLIRGILDSLISPIVHSLVAIVQHIGMAVPSSLNEIVEKIEEGVHIDLNGDGIVGQND